MAQLSAFSARVAQRDVAPDREASPNRQARFVLSPGRINVLGEHTDTSEGFCLPTAVDRDLLCAFVPSGDARIRVKSLDVPGVLELGESREVAPGSPSYGRYVAALVTELAESPAFRRRQARALGFDLVLDSTIPRGGGMSSSAALCVALALAIANVADVQLSPLEIALAAQAAEHRVGVRCGLMDQYSIAHGRAGQALLLDTRNRSHQEVPLALGEYVFVVGDTKKARGLVDSEYNARRAQVEEAAVILDAGSGTIVNLRDATASLIEARREQLGPLLFRRARHVVEENARAIHAARLLQEAHDAGQPFPAARLGQLLDASHASLRDDFEVSCAELDALVLSLRERGDVLVPGARMMGGGFGGCVIALVQKAALSSVLGRASQEYHARTGLEAAFFSVAPCDGARLIERPK